jgi:hypothetical protein
MLTEIEALWHDPMEYLDEWGTNLTDFFPLILLYVNTIRSLNDPGPVPKSFWIIQSLTSISIWLKFVYFLRSQYYFSYLVRSLREAVQDIFTFLVILIITCLGFADAFLSLSRSMEQGFLTNYYGAFRYSWLFVLGQNDLIEDADYYADILYFLASILILIIMLNTLIALAGASLERAKENKVEYEYKAKVELLRELQGHFVLRFWEKVRALMCGRRNTNEHLIFVSFVQTS